jgi:ribosomal protein L11 methyltransferase
MSFTALRFDAPGELADAWGDALLEAGALSVDASDPFAGTSREQARFHEPGEPSAPAWRHSRLVALFARERDAQAALAAAAQALGQPLPPCERYAVEAQDWVRATQAQFGPIDVAGRLAIVPSWCDPLPGRVTLRLDPGLAFGTGSHPTTRLCLEWLIEHVRPASSVLDYGCGSGVLAIAAAKLGATGVAGTDVDEQALRASRDNARANDVKASFVLPEALPREPFDLVVANILANPLILLAPAIAARVKVGGRLALAGILDEQAERVAAAHAQWFTLARWCAADGWTLLAGVRER